MDTPKLRLSQEMDELLASALPDFTSDELMMLLASPPALANPSASVSRLESVAPAIIKPTEKKKKRTPWNKGLRKNTPLWTTTRNQSFRKRRKLSNAVSPVVELPPIAIIENDHELAKSPIAATTTTIAQTEMSAMTTTSAMIELGEAQRLSDMTVQEWFARRGATDATLVEEVDKRLVMMIARKKLAESQQALAKACVADAVAHAISLTLFK
jgi:hypothetical protein